LVRQDVLMLGISKSWHFSF